MYNLRHIKTESTETLKPDPFFSNQTAEHIPATHNTRQIKTEPTESIKPDPFFSNQTAEHIPATHNTRQLKTEPTENIKTDPFFSNQTLEHIPATHNTRQIKTEPTENIKPDPFFSNPTGVEHIPATHNIGQIKTEPNENIGPDPFDNDNRPASPPARRYPILPLTHPPKCRNCGETSRNRKNVFAGNRNGNFGRPYYICSPCEMAGKRAWITWDDWQGIYADNPECDCGLVSRRDRAGAKSASSGCEFLKCAVGGCGYWEWVDREDQILGDYGTTEESATLGVKIR